MNRKPTLPLLALLALLAQIAIAAPPAAADDAWRLAVSGFAVQSTVDGGPSGSIGYGLGLGYRLTRRIGVAIDVATGEIDEEAEFRFLQPTYYAEKEIRMTPALARLDLHLTPGRRVDLYLGPVAGHVWMGDVTVRVRNRNPPLPGQRSEGRIGVEDQLTWGAHVGVDVRLGDSGSYLTAGATWLELPLELELPDLGPAEGPLLEILFLPIGDDVDPLFLHLGVAYRF